MRYVPACGDYTVIDVKLSVTAVVHCCYIKYLHVLSCHCCSFRPLMFIDARDDELIWFTVAVYVCVEIRS